MLAVEARWLDTKSRFDRRSLLETVRGIHAAIEGKVQGRGMVSIGIDIRRGKGVGMDNVWVMILEIRRFSKTERGTREGTHSWNQSCSCCSTKAPDELYPGYPLLGNPLWLAEGSLGTRSCLPWDCV